MAVVTEDTYIHVSLGWGEDERALPLPYVYI